MTEPNETDEAYWTELRQQLCQDDRGDNVGNMVELSPTAREEEAAL